ncbi:MAG TPA: hypothetical protein RMH99_07485 [Sandaracinaceae bacterium LLY-WYZ-13_1]|nr:hypothetical protein [Sandaracinaceae bacterium LLY-WYZ-13_1]
MTWGRWVSAVFAATVVLALAGGVSAQADGEADSEVGSGSASGSASGAGGVDSGAGALASPRRSEQAAGPREPTRPRSGVWVFDDGVEVDDVPWDDFDEHAMYRPRGRSHFGVQLRAGGLLGDVPPAPAGPWAEVGIFYDLRYSPRRPWHLRFVAAFSMQPPGRDSSPGAIRESNTWVVRTRVLPLSIDFGSWVTGRLGGGVMFAWLPDFAGGGDFQVRPEIAGEVTANLLDGHLELGLYTGMTYSFVRSMGTMTFGNVDDGVQGQLGVTVGWVLP